MIVHVHIPKTGGSSLRAALGCRYSVWRPRGPRGQGDAHEGVVELVRRGEPLPEVDVIAGHIPLGVRDYLPEGVQYVTVLRDPVERALSHYFTEFEAEDWNAGTAPSFSETRAAERHVLDNLQVRYLSGSLDVFAGPTTPAMLDAATENLERITFGFTEHLEALFERLDLQPQRERVNEWRPRAEIPPDLLDAAKEANQLDTELFHRALALGV